MNAEIRQAIADKKLVEFRYQNFIRIAEPMLTSCVAGSTTCLLTKYAAEAVRRTCQNGPLYHSHK